MASVRVLVVEDERIIAKGIEKSLKSIGYDVVGLASNGEEALRAVPGANPDLVLMDIHLGSGMDGIQAAETLRRSRDLPVVFLTAHSDSTTLERAKFTEPFGYVLKPYEERDLQTAIEIGLYRHRMEKQLRENEKWFAATLGSIGDGVIATDESGNVRFLNALAERMTGWTLADARGRPVEDVFRLVHMRSREPMQCPVRKSLQLGLPSELEPDAVLIDRSGGERPVDDSSAPIRNARGVIDGAVLVFRDITERIRLEEHLRQAQKMEAVGRLAGGIAHDFNNIMTVILGFSELLLTDPDAANREGMVRDIVAASRRAAAITQQIMAFSRNQILMPAVLDLNAVLRDMNGMIRRLVGDSVVVATEPAAGLGHVRADPAQLGQVLLNLAANARDAMPLSGGRLTISTANVEPGPNFRLRHPEAAPGRYVELAVRDTGAGIPPEAIDRVFEPFFTTKPIGEGTGLGLAIVHGIVKQSGGEIEVESRTGAGATFRIYLPRLDEKLAAPVRDVRQPVRGQGVILFVEGDDAVRVMAKRVLEHVGYMVLDAADGIEALERSAQHAGRIDLLVTDLVMPRMPGREVADRLAAARPGLPVLFISGYTDDVTVLHGVATGTANFLHKPFTLASLTAKVREVMLGNSES